MVTTVYEGREVSTQEASLFYSRSPVSTVSNFYNFSENPVEKAIG